MLVELARVKGSAPREEGAWMSVSADAVAGTIGGGQLEWRAIEIARQMLADQQEASEVDIPLGPEIGQCCGGRVTLRFRRLDDAVIARMKQDAEHAERQMPQVLIFGAGHTGVALANALAALPYRTRLIDTRRDLPVRLRSTIETEIVAIPEAEIEAASPGSAYIVMTHDHGLDFMITAAALKRGDAAYCGLIGSKTKRAVFESWLADNGYRGALAQQLVCPIGGSIVYDKRPQIIAALAAAEIVTALHQYQSAAMR